MGVLSSVPTGASNLLSSVFGSPKTSGTLANAVAQIPGLTSLFGKTEFEKMKKGAGLINCARGGVVDESALIEALDSGILAYAALDVFIKEPNPDNILLNHPKISLTPHIGASTKEAQYRISLEVAETIIRLTS